MILRYSASLFLIGVFMAYVRWAIFMSDVAFPDKSGIFDRALLFL